MTGELLVNIDVDDLAKAADFYCRALGLEVGRTFGGGMIELLGGSSPIYLLEKPAGSAATSTSTQRRDYSRHWTPVHLDFIVPDIQAAVGRAVAAGARPETGVKAANWGKSAVFADPFGNGFCLIEFINSGYDEIADQQR